MKSRIAILSLIGLLWALAGASADSRTGIYRVADFGAAGDGVKDDTAAIRAAIAEASKSGGVVQLDRGKYRITGSLKIEANDVVLQGQGRGTSTIWADGLDFHAIAIGRDDLEVRNVALSSFSIDRPKPANPEIANVYTARARYCSMDNLGMGNGGDGIFVGSRTAADICGCISITRAWMGSCRRCLVAATAADITVSHMYGGFSDIGVYLTGGANNIRLTDSVFLTSRPDQGKHGLLSDGGFMQEVKGCVFEETSAEVIKVVGTLRFFFHDNWLNANPEFPMVRLEKVVVFEVNNTRFGGSGTTCVALDGCARGQVAGNHMESSRGVGVDVKGGDHIDISSNQMGGNWTFGVRLSDGAQSIGITGNHIGGSECPIRLTATSAGKIIIKGNFMTKGKLGYIVNESRGKQIIVKDNVEE